MSTEPIGKVVQALCVALMNGIMYFAEHRRVSDAAQQAIAGLEQHFRNHERLVLGVVKGLLIAKGVPLYDLSARAHRLMDAITEHGGFGLRFTRGIAATEIGALIKALLQARTSSPEEFNALLAQQGVVHVMLLAKPLREASADAGETAESVSDAPAAGAEATVDDKCGAHIELYDGALSSIRTLIADFRRDRKLSLAKTHDVAVGLTDALATDHDGFVAMASVKDYDSYTFNHSVNVCIYATALAEQLTTDRKECIAIAQAALLHDVGKLLIPDEVLFKQGALTDGEWATMRQHPRFGAKILLEACDGAEIAVNVAFGHHLRYDQKGYPRLPAPITVDPVTQLINVIDVYEALTAARPYKKPFTPEHAADVLLRGVGTEFNPLCVDLFLRHFGIYPPGTPVCLVDGSTGVVTAANPCDAAHPIVRLTHAPDGSVLSAPQIVDTSEKTPAGTYRMEIAFSTIGKEVPASA